MHQLLHFAAMLVYVELIGAYLFVVNYGFFDYKMV